MRYQNSPSLVLFVIVAFGSRLAEGETVTRVIPNAQLNAQDSDEYTLDVDSDGKIDFTLQTFFSNDTALLLGFDQTIVSFGSPNGLVLRAPATDGFPSASLLTPGDIVGPSNIFTAGSNDTVNFFSSDPFQGATGEFGGKRGSFGFRFDSGATFRYGFADISVNDLNSSAPFNLPLLSVSYLNQADRSR